MVLLIPKAKIARNQLLIKKFYLPVKYLNFEPCMVEKLN